MKVHYFQRYKSKENVATANSMLLLSRLYSYSSEKFYRLIKTVLVQGLFDPEISFEMQKGNGASVPDAIISQPSFKIAIETKLYDWFSTNQLIRHLESFRDENYKVLISLASEPMDDKKLLEVNKQISEYNVKHNCKPYIVHVNLTFEALANAVKDTLHEHDYEMISVVDDFFDYCYNDDLIKVPDSWKFVRMALAGTTIDFNMREGIYYMGAEQGYRPHDYVGLYNMKSMRAIGKIEAIVTAVETPKGLECKAEKGVLTEEVKEKIIRAIADGDRYRYDLHNHVHRYFIVDKFYETDFNKTTPYGPMGSRVFDLTQVLGTLDLPSVEDIADLLKAKSWA